MQDFSLYDYRISIEELSELVKQGGVPVLVIINGEYYEITESKSET